MVLVDDGLATGATMLAAVDPTRVPIKMTREKFLERVQQEFP